MGRDSRTAATVYGACGVGAILALQLSARESGIALVSWQSAGLLGVALAIAVGTYALVRCFTDRDG